MGSYLIVKSVVLSLRENDLRIHFVGLVYKHLRDVRSNRPTMQYVSVQRELDTNPVASFGQWRVG